MVPNFIDKMDKTRQIMLSAKLIYPERSPSSGGGCAGVTRTQSASPTNSNHSPTIQAMLEQFEFTKCLFLFFYLALAGVSNWAVFSFTHDRVGREALPDLLFELFPEQEWAATWGDFAVTCTLICLAILLFFHRSRILILRRAFFIAGTLYAMRSISLLFTQLPPGYVDNYKRCRGRENTTTAAVFFSRLLEQTIRLGFQAKDGMLCGDLLFSGHTLVMMTCTQSVHYYLPKKLKILAAIPYLITFTGIGCLIASRTHYTVDVIFAFWLSTFVFILYHTYCEIDIVVERRHSILHSLFLMKIVNWLEEEIVPGRVDNILELPFGSFMEKHFDAANQGHHKQISISSSSTFGLP